MTQTQLSRAQEKNLGQWWFLLTGVWNWAVRKIDDRDVNTAGNTLLAAAGTTVEVAYA